MEVRWRWKGRWRLGGGGIEWNVGQVKIGLDGVPGGGGAGWSGV